MSYAHTEWCPTCGAPIMSVTRGIPSEGCCQNGHWTDRRDVLRRAPENTDVQATIARLTAERDEARAAAKRMDRARDQFLGERNILAEALSGIHRGDMTNMMEFTEAEAAKIKAGWALNKIGTPAATALAEMLDAETRACAEVVDNCFFTPDNDIEEARFEGIQIALHAILARIDQRKEAE